jgi:hypothetical protein
MEKNYNNPEARKEVEELLRHLLRRLEIRKINADPDVDKETAELDILERTLPKTDGSDSPAETALTNPHDPLITELLDKPVDEAIHLIRLMTGINPASLTEPRLRIAAAPAALGDPDIAVAVGDSADNAGVSGDGNTPDPRFVGRSALEELHHRDEVSAALPIPVAVASTNSTVVNDAGGASTFGRSVARDVPLNLVSAVQAHYNPPHVPRLHLPSASVASEGDSRTTLPDERIGRSTSAPPVALTFPVPLLVTPMGPEPLPPLREASGSSSGRGSQKSLPRAAAAFSGRHSPSSGGSRSPDITGAGAMPGPASTRVDFATEGIFEMDN